MPRAAVVVEDRYAAVFKLDRVRPAVVADGLAECQVRWPAVPIVLCDTRKLAQEWTYRFLAAAVVHAGEERHTRLEASPLPAAAPPSPAQVRAWAREQGYAVSDRGRVSREILDAFARRHG